MWLSTVQRNVSVSPSLIARFMGPTWGPPGFCRPRCVLCRFHEPCYLGYQYTYCGFDSALKYSWNFIGYFLKYHYSDRFYMSMGLHLWSNFKLLARWWYMISIYLRFSLNAELTILIWNCSRFMASLYHIKFWLTSGCFAVIRITFVRFMSWICVEYFEIHVIPRAECFLYLFGADLYKKRCKLGERTICL